MIDYLRRLTEEARPAWLRLGIGDDAAVVEPPGAGPVVLTTDMVAEGVHFQAGTPPRAVAHKAVARGLSDLAAMAARPLCIVAAAQFGDIYDAAERRELVAGLVESAESYRAPLIGGDLAGTAAALSITVTALGTPGPRGVIRRSGARPGDGVCVTGELGGSILGGHLEFSPRLEEALALAERYAVRAMIDVSDGLSTDALHLAEASEVGVELRCADIPLAEAASRRAQQTGKSACWHALNDGEDYELLFCLPPGSAARLAEEGVAGVPVSVIGEVTEGRESRLVWPDGRREPLRPQGWEHQL